MIVAGFWLWKLELKYLEIGVERRVFMNDVNGESAGFSYFSVSVLSLGLDLKFVYIKILVCQLSLILISTSYSVAW